MSFCSRAGSNLHLLIAMSDLHQQPRQLPSFHSPRLALVCTFINITRSRCLAACVGPSSLPPSLAHSLASLHPVHRILRARRPARAAHSTTEDQPQRSWRLGPPRFSAHRDPRTETHEPPVACHLYIAANIQGRGGLGSRCLDASSHAE